MQGGGHARTRVMARRTQANWRLALTDLLRGAVAGHGEHGHDLGVRVCIAPQVEDVVWPVVMDDVRAHLPASGY